MAVVQSSFPRLALPNGPYSKRPHSCKISQLQSANTPHCWLSIVQAKLKFLRRMSI